MKENSSSRYAKALFELSLSESKVDVIFSNIELIFNTLELKKELFTIVHNPTISKDVKSKIFNKAFGPHVDTLTMRFLTLIIQRSRESLLLQMVKNYIDLYYQHKGVVIASVTSAKRLNDSDRLAIKAKINPNGKVKLTEFVEPSILGGLIINTKGKQYNTSVKKQINNIKKVFEL
jgi:F-type H+-transporting ATPase subunit delta